MRFDRDLTEQSRLEYADLRGPLARDFGEDVAFGRSGGVFVAGYSNYDPPGVSGFLDSALLLRVNSAGTGAAWSQRYQPSGVGAVAERLVLDGSDSLYVGGYLETPRNEDDMMLLKYSAAGVKKWAAGWHDTGRDDDWVSGLALGGTNALYAAGTGIAKGGFEQSALLRVNR